MPLVRIHGNRYIFDRVSHNQQCFNGYEAIIGVSDVLPRK
jgi:hypothetical protein